MPEPSSIDLNPSSPLLPVRWHFSVLQHKKKQRKKIENHLPLPGHLLLHPVDVPGNLSLLAHIVSGD